MNPEVSIIIPSYNHGHFVRCAVESVLAQTSTDWEVNIVDDGSTDNTRAVVSQFADTRLHYIYQENQGLCAARNTGIQSSQGTYLAFLDADDEWCPPFLETCLGTLKANETLGGVYTLNYFIDEGGTVLPQLGGEVVPCCTFRERNLQSGFFPPNAALIRASVIDKAGLFDTGLSGEGDWDFWIRVSEHYTMQGIPKPLARYRVVSNSMSMDVAHMHRDAIKVITKHFGPPAGNVDSWPEEKRRVYGFAYSTTAMRYIQQCQTTEGWRFFTRAALTWPPILGCLETFYELALGDQPRGYRGQVGSLDIDRNAKAMLNGLDELLSQHSAVLGTMHGIAYGNAYLALAMLSDQAGRWRAAREYLWRGIVAHPELLALRSNVRRLIKLCAGQRLVNLVRRTLGKG